MAGLNSNGFALSDYPSLEQIPKSLTSFDVGAVYNSVKQGMDVADTARRNAEAAYVAPAQDQAAITNAGTNILTDQSKIAQLPSATGAAIAGNNFSAGKANTDTSLLPKYALAQGAQYDAGAAQSQYGAGYYGALNKAGVPGQAAAATGKEVGNAAASPTGVGVNPVTVGGVQAQAQQAPSPPLAQQPQVPAMAAAPSAQPDENGEYGAGEQPASVMAAPDKPLAAAPSSAPQNSAAPAGTGSATQFPLAQGAQPAPAAAPSPSGGFPVGNIISQIGPGGLPTSKFAELPLAQLMRTPVGSTAEPVIGQNGQPNLGPNGGVMTQNFNVMGNGAKIPNGPPHEEFPQGAPPGGAGGQQPVGAVANEPAPLSDVGLPNSLKAPAAAVQSVAQFPLVAATPAPPRVNLPAGASPVQAQKILGQATEEWQRNIAKQQAQAKDQIDANRQAATNTDTVENQLNEALKANEENMGIPRGLLQTSTLAQNLATVFSPQYQAAKAFAIQQFAQHIPKGLNRVTQTEWTNMIASSVSPGNDLETNRLLEANIHKVLSRDQELNSAYNQYVDNSPSKTDTGWAEFQDRYLRDNPLTAPPELRVTVPTYSHLLASGVADPTAYVRANGNPPPQALLTAEKGGAPLPQVNPSSLDGGPGRVIKPQALPPGAKPGTELNLGGSTWRVLPGNSVVKLQ